MSNTKASEYYRNVRNQKIARIIRRRRFEDMTTIEMFYIDDDRREAFGISNPAFFSLFERVND